MPKTNRKPGIQINYTELKKWIAALDSREYMQGNSQLQDECGYCCLGVGCVVTIHRSLLSMKNGRLDGLIPKEQEAAPIWLKQINDDFEDKTGHSLSYINDMQGYTFPEIATLLELVYIHKILD